MLRQTATAIFALSLKVAATVFNY